MTDQSENILREQKDIKIASVKHTGFGFMSNKETIEEGDTVIIYVNYGTCHAVEVKRGLTLTMKYGALKHEYLIGKRYGSRISATAGYVYVLRPNADMWTHALLRRTQIIYTPDSALILMLLDIKPGSIVCECGTGSGSLSHALAMAIAPTGHLYTHDIDERRVKQVEIELKKHGLGDVSTCVHQDVLEDGFFVENACDAVFLDLPAPWNAVSHAKRALNRSRGGRIVSFSPCIEQVQRACSALRREGFVQISTVELVSRKLKVCDVNRDTLQSFNSPKGGSDMKETIEDCGINLASKKRKLKRGYTEASEEVLYHNSALLPFPASQPTHSGYIISATMLSSVS